MPENTEGFKNQQAHFSEGAQRIEKKYPNVKSLMIKKDYFDDLNKPIGRGGDWDVPIDTGRAYFYSDCPLRECVDGGFDLGGIIDTAIKNKVQTKEGTLICQGWQDPNRVGQHQCLTGLKYKIEIRYK